MQNGNVEGPQPLRKDQRTRCMPVVPVLVHEIPWRAALPCVLSMAMTAAGAWLLFQDYQSALGPRYTDNLKLRAFDELSVWHAPVQGTVSRRRMADLCRLMSKCGSMMQAASSAAVHLCSQPVAHSVNPLVPQQCCSLYLALYICCGSAALRRQAGASLP